MPRAELPRSIRGWIVAIAASFVGFISGFMTIALLGGLLNG